MESVTKDRSLITPSRLAAACPLFCAIATLAEVQSKTGTRSDLAYNFNGSVTTSSPLYLVSHLQKRTELAMKAHESFRHINRTEKDVGWSFEELVATNESNTMVDEDKRNRVTAVINKIADIIKKRNPKSLE